MVGMVSAAVWRDLVSANNTSRVCKRVPGDVERVIELVQRQVGRGDVADKRSHYGFAGLLRAQKTAPPRLGRASQPAPDIDVNQQKRQRARPDAEILPGQ